MTDTYGLNWPLPEWDLDLRWRAVDEHIIKNGRLQFVKDDVVLCDIPIAELDKLESILRAVRRNALDTELRLKDLDGL
jgi:hypothetical protein